MIPRRSWSSAGRGSLLATDGDIRAIVRAVLDSDEFRGVARAEAQNAVSFCRQRLRALGADTFAHDPLIEYLGRMGQGVFQYPTPDGYPDKASPCWQRCCGDGISRSRCSSNSVPSVAAPMKALLAAIGATPRGCFGEIVRALERTRSRRASARGAGCREQFKRRGCPDSLVSRVSEVLSDAGQSIAEELSPATSSLPSPLPFPIPAPQRSSASSSAAAPTR